MSDDLKLKGPYEMDIVVHITNGNHEGKITLGLTMGTPPTQKGIDAAMKKAKKKAKEAGFRLMNKSEFFNKMINERLGGTSVPFAVPGGDEWDT